jgi:hypothetical protein
VTDSPSIVLVQRALSVATAIDPQLMKTAVFTAHLDINVRQMILCLRKSIYAHSVEEKTVKWAEGATEVRIEKWVNYPDLIIPGMPRFAQLVGTNVYPDDDEWPTPAQ